MSKVFKIIAKGPLIILEWLLFLFICLLFALNTSYFQTKLAQIATNYLATELKTKIHIGGIHISFLDEIAFEDFCIYDQSKDTLLSAKHIFLRTKSFNLDREIFKLKQITFESGQINITRNKTTGDYNYWFITDYFDSGSGSASSSHPRVLVDAVAFSNYEVNYDDFRKSYSTLGIDYDHIKTKDVSFLLTHLSNYKGITRFQLAQFSAKEKSGFKIQELTAKVALCDTFVKLGNLHLNTPYSNLNAAKLHLFMANINNLQYIEDSVDFDGIISPSMISFIDLAHFAPELTGMNAQVKLRAEISQKVKNLAIKNLDLSYAEKTRLQGNFILPDYRDFEHAILRQHIKRAHVDLGELKKIKLPNTQRNKYIELDEHLERLGFFNIQNMHIDGFHDQFVIAADSIKTQIGSIALANGIMFSRDVINNWYSFTESTNTKQHDLRVHRFALGKLLNDHTFGNVDAHLSLSGRIHSWEKIDFDSIQGTVNEFNYLNYAYKNLLVHSAQFAGNKLVANLDFKDKHFESNFNGFIDFNGQMIYNFVATIGKAELHELNLTQADSTLLQTTLTVNLTGSELNTLKGSITAAKTHYAEGQRFFDIPLSTVTLAHVGTDDVITFNSSLLDAVLKGKLNLSQLDQELFSAFNKVFPAIQLPFAQQKRVNKELHSQFSYNINSKELTKFLDIFVPDLYIGQNSNLFGSIDAKNKLLTTTLTSPKITYKGIDFLGINISNEFNHDELNALFSINALKLNDSIQLDKLQFSTNGQSNHFESSISWNPNTVNESNISWETNFLEDYHINFILNPSFFSLNDQKWTISKASDFTITPYETHISKLILERGNQSIAADGCLSSNESDKITCRLKNINLHDLGQMLGSSYELDGTFNGWTAISNTDNHLKYMGDGRITNLFIDKREVGDIYVQSEWNDKLQHVILQGDLAYRGNQTFAFNGGYFFEREKDILDFELNFKEMDLGFSNAFMDPDILNNISGKIDGMLRLKGTVNEPNIYGKLNLLDGEAKIDLLNTFVKLGGQIDVDKYGFYIDNMPIYDEEQNAGRMVASIYHNNLSNWNYDFQFDLENSTNSSNAFRSNTTERFLILNTTYHGGDYYYGRGYVTGSANISGDLNETAITIDLKTERGTQLYFPMFESGDLDEEDDLLTFVSKDVDLSSIVPKIDFTGVDLDMRFRMTPEAKLKVIFNEQTGDEIAANGQGDITMRLSNINELTMDGTYEVKEGTYNFAMGPVKQPFHIEEGGTITWTGDPYNARLALRTYYDVNADINELTESQTQGGSRTLVQKIRCYLNLTDLMISPTIAFDIAAPSADETGKALLSRVTTDKDQLNRQFFSLMLWKKFQPLTENVRAGESAALDLASNQINSLLSQVSSQYKLNVNLDANNNTGKKSYAVGVTKGFMNDRLVFTGNFGVENSTTLQQQNALIGDMSLEYTLNESGTFRVNVFNQSLQANNTSTSALTGTGQGFTQGIGIHYQEDFNDINDFQLAQSFLDIFRKKKERKKRKQTPIPDSTPLNSSINSPKEEQKNVPKSKDTPSN